MFQAADLRLSRNRVPVALALAETDEIRRPAIGSRTAWQEVTERKNRMHPHFTRRTLLAASLSASAGVIAGLDSPPAAHAANQNRRSGRVAGSGIVPDPYSTVKTVDGTAFRYTWKHDGRWVNIGFKPARRFTSSGAARKFSTLEHSHNRELMVMMAWNDPYKFDFLVPLVAAIVSRAQSIGKDPAALLLSFVQGFSYKDEDGYQSWPTQVLLHAHGDCSDSSVLFAALINIYHKYHVRRVRRSEQTPLWVYLFGVGTDTHMAVGIRRHTNRMYSGTRWLLSWGGVLRGYYVCETTGTGWKIGQRPPGTLEKADVVPPMLPVDSRSRLGVAATPW